MRYNRFVRFVPWSLALCMLIAACGGGARSRPSSALDAYAAALDAGDYEKAYSLMSTRYRREHSLEEFTRLMKQSPQDVKETAARLRTARGRPELTATMSYGELDDEILLVEEGGEWRIASDPLAFYPQATPEEALRSFLRAVDAERWEVVLRFVPDEYRKHMSAEQVRAEFQGERREQNEEMLERLKNSLRNPIQVEGDQARMPYGDRYEVKFVRENGMWKIEDLY